MIDKNGQVHTEPLLLSPWSAQLQTRSGVKLNIRPVSPDDEQRLLEFFQEVSPEDLRYRFLTAVPQVRANLVRGLIDVDHSCTEHFLAFDAATDTLVATAMVAAEPTLARAEVAIVVRADHKHLGVGWTLLEHMADYAAARGIKRLESIESWANREAITLEREAGFTVTSYPGDATLVLVGKNIVPPTAGA